MWPPHDPSLRYEENEDTGHEFQLPMAIMSRFSSLLSTLLFVLPAAITALNPGFPYGEVPVRGVSLGGWLSTEPWITPSLFDKTGNDLMVDEYTFGQLQPREVALAALKEHWDTFITEADIAEIAAAGLNHIRVPIGYWAFESGFSNDEPYISGQLPYLHKVIGWATNHGLKVIIDLHGAPGSQNGLDNSGERTDPPRWHSNRTNVERTNEVIKEIAGLFANDPTNIPIIAPLNEPAGFKDYNIVTTARQYWLDSYQSIRYPAGQSESSTVVLISDAFQHLGPWAGFMTVPEHENVAMDIHIYPRGECSFR